MDAAAVTAPLERELHCVRYGYNLRGLDEKGRCTECGLELYWSLRAPSKLSQYPATWVATMAWAVRLMLLAYGGVFLLLVGNSLQILPKSETLFLDVIAAAAVLQLIGMWMLSRSSRHFAEAVAPINRWTLRIAPSAIVIALALAIWANKQNDATLFWFSTAFGVVGAAAPTSIFIRLRTVARMIADPHLAEHSAIVGWGFFVSIVFMFLIAFVPMSRFVGPTSPIGLGLILTSGVSVLLFLLW